MLPPPENCFELAGPWFDVPSSNVMISTPSDPNAGEFSISGTSLARNASNWATPLPCGLQLSCPSSHSLGTTRLNRPTLPVVTAPLNVLMSFGPVLVFDARLTRRQAHTGKRWDGGDKARSQRRFG